MVEVAAGSGVSAGDGTTVGGVLVTESLKPELAPTGVNSTGTRRRAAGGGTVAGDGTGAGTSDGPYSITERAATPTLAAAGVTANDRLVTFVITITPALSDAGVGVLAGTGLTFKETIPDHLFVTLARADGVSVSLGRADGVSVSLGLRRRGENPEV